MAKKSTLVLALAGTLTTTGNLSGTSPARATERAHPPESCYQIDLRSGVNTPPPPFIEFVVPPEDFDGDGWFEAVLKVRVNDPSSRSPEAARFLVTYDGEPAGISVHIGDSDSNDGWSGDGGNQSNDAEVQLGGRLDLPEDSPLYDDLSVYGKDGSHAARGTGWIAQVVNVVKRGQTIALTASNERIWYQNDEASESGEIHSPWLYALAGQPDSEGPVNYEIYAAFNRVIAGNYRSGSGAGRVNICPVWRPKAKKGFVTNSGDAR